MTALFTMSMVTTVSNVCSKCGKIKKSGKRSCCGRGGAWFKNCGDAGDTQFDHSWTEGIQACKEFSISVESPAEVIQRHVEVVAYPQSTVRPQQQTNNHPPGSISNADIRDCKYYIRFGKVTVCICVVFIISHLES